MSSANTTKTDHTRYDWNWFRSRPSQTTEREPPERGGPESRAFHDAKIPETQPEAPAASIPTTKEDELVILSLLNDFEDELRAGYPLPFTSKILVDEGNLQYLVDQMRDTLPKTILEAEQIKLHELDILEEAKDRAGQYVARAQREADALIEEERIVEKAKERAQEILENAQQEVTRLRTDAQDEAFTVRAQAEKDVDELYDRLSRNLERVLEQLRR